MKKFILQQIFGRILTKMLDIDDVVCLSISDSSQTRVSLL